MATAFLSLATPVRTAIIPSVCRVSVSGTLVLNNLVAPVYPLHVKLECLASITLVPGPIMIHSLFATLMPEKAAI